MRAPLRRHPIEGRNRARKRQISRNSNGIFHTNLSPTDVSPLSLSDRCSNHSSFKTSASDLRETPVKTIQDHGTLHTYRHEHRPTIVSALFSFYYFSFSPVVWFNILAPNE
eukprot:500218-Ditylum_brightwellii.AAC.1